MSKKIGKKIWIYVGVGVFLVIVGIISWGVATDWKFIGDSKKSGGGGPSPPSPPSPPSEDPCDPTKCKQCSSDKKKCMLCYDGYTLNDGICVCQDENKKLNKCCPKGSTRDNAGTCCPNNRLTTSGDCCSDQICKLKNNNVCCDKGEQCDNDGKGCYIKCGGQKCYNGGKCIKNDNDGTQYCESKDCTWNGFPQPNPSYISGVDQKYFTDCKDNLKCTCDSNGICTVNTTGIRSTDGKEGQLETDGNNNPYTFFYKNSGLLKDKKYISEITAPSPGEGATCDDTDCGDLLSSIYGLGNIEENMKKGICKMEYDAKNVLQYNQDGKCPFENDPSKRSDNPALQCCSNPFGGVTGQICPVGTVGSLEPTKSGNILHTCVPLTNCVGEGSAQICNNSGTCDLQPDKKSGKCSCATDKDPYCMNFLNVKYYQFKVTNANKNSQSDIWRFIPFYQKCWYDDDDDKVCTIFDNTLPSNPPQNNFKDYINNNQMALVNEGTLYQIITDRFTNIINTPVALSVRDLHSKNPYNEYKSSWQSIDNEVSNGNPRYFLGLNEFVIVRNLNKIDGQTTYSLISPDQIISGENMFNSMFVTLDSNGHIDAGGVNDRLKLIMTIDKKCPGADGIMPIPCQIFGFNTPEITQGIALDTTGTCQYMDNEFDVGGNTETSFCGNKRQSRFENSCSTSKDPTDPKGYYCNLSCSLKQRDYCYGTWGNAGCVCQRTALSNTSSKLDDLKFKVNLTVFPS